MIHYQSLLLRTSGFLCRYSRLFSWLLVMVVLPATATPTATDNALVDVAAWLIKLAVYGFGGIVLTIGLIQAVRIKVFGGPSHQGDSPMMRILAGAGLLLTPAMFEIAKAILTEASGEGTVEEIFNPFD